jgi:hypothetical protein
MRWEEFISRLYLNIYWMHQGDRSSIEEVLTRFSQEITEASENQVKRLNLICENDAFLNAFTMASNLAQLLDLSQDELLRKSMQEW